MWSPFLSAQFSAVPRSIRFCVSVVIRFNIYHSSLHAYSFHPHLVHLLYYYIPHPHLVPLVHFSFHSSADLTLYFRYASLGLSPEISDLSRSLATLSHTHQHTHASAPPFPSPHHASLASSTYLVTPSSCTKRVSTSPFSFSSPHLGVGVFRRLQLV